MQKCAIFFFSFHFLSHARLQSWKHFSQVMDGHLNGANLLSPLSIIMILTIVNCYLKRTSTIVIVQIQRVLRSPIFIAFYFFLNCFFFILHHNSWKITSFAWLSWNAINLCVFFLFLNDCKLSWHVIPMCWLVNNHLRFYTHEEKEKPISHTDVWLAKLKSIQRLLVLRKKN